MQISEKGFVAPKQFMVVNNTYDPFAIGKAYLEGVIFMINETLSQIRKPFVLWTHDLVMEHFGWRNIVIKRDF